MKIEGSIYFFPAYYDEETEEVELKECWFNKHTEWLFDFINEIEGIVFYFLGVEHYFVFKEKISKKHKL
jgi:hypothetical protein